MTGVDWQEGKISGWVFLNQSGIDPPSWFVDADGDLHVRTKGVAPDWVPEYLSSSIPRHIHIYDERGRPLRVVDACREQVVLDLFAEAREAGLGATLVAMQQHASDLDGQGAGS
jgi:hypothetical protein